MIKKFGRMVAARARHFGTLRALADLLDAGAQTPHRRSPSTAQNTQQYEPSLLEETLVHDLAMLREDGLFAHARDPLQEHKCSQKLLEHMAVESIPCEGASRSSRARLASGQLASFSDVVLGTTSAAGEAHTFRRLREQPVCFVELYELEKN